MKGSRIEPLASRTGRREVLSLRVMVESTAFAISLLLEACLERKVPSFFQNESAELRLATILTRSKSEKDSESLRYGYTDFLP